MLLNFVNGDEQVIRNGDDSSSFVDWFGGTDANNTFSGFSEVGRISKTRVNQDPIVSEPLLIANINR